MFFRGLLEGKHILLDKNPKFVHQTLTRAPSELLEACVSPSLQNLTNMKPGFFVFYSFKIVGHLVTRTNLTGRSMITRTRTYTFADSPQ